MSKTYTDMCMYEYMCTYELKHIIINNWWLVYLYMTLTCVLIDCTDMMEFWILHFFMLKPKSTAIILFSTFSLVHASG